MPVQLPSKKILFKYKRFFLLTKNLAFKANFCKLALEFNFCVIVSMINEQQLLEKYGEIIKEEVNVKEI